MDLQGKYGSIWTQPKGCDLALVREYNRDKRRKLELRWIGSELVIELSETRVAGYNPDDLKTRHRVDHVGIFLVNKLST